MIGLGSDKYDISGHFPVGVLWRKVCHEYITSGDNKERAVDKEFKFVENVLCFASNYNVIM